MKTFIAIFISLSLMISLAHGAGTESIEPESSRDTKYYNKGVDLMLDKEFSRAEKQFREALGVREGFAEAHNNLAYVLRKQGSDHFEEALTH